MTPEERLKYISTPPYVLPFPLHKKLVAPAMTYISGEEMTRYTMELILEQWIRPHIDISKWEFFDLSCKARDATNDKVLHDAVASGARMCAIFKEPTITPSAVQVKEMGLKKVITPWSMLAVLLTVTPANLSFLSPHSHHERIYQAWGSPNGAMRRGWNGITISRDTIHIEGVKLGRTSIHTYSHIHTYTRSIIQCFSPTSASYTVQHTLIHTTTTSLLTFLHSPGFDKIVLFDRHAVGGEYGAGWRSVGEGRLVTTFFPEDGSSPIICDDRVLKGNHNNNNIIYNNRKYSKQCQ